MFEGIDFSSAPGTLFSTALSGTFFTLKNCKMNAGSVVGAFTAAQLALQIDLINCDGGGAIYRNERYNIYGNLLTSKGIYRTGGAVDGGVPISQNIAATSFCRPQRPFLGFPLSIWNDTVGSPVTVTVYGALNGVSTRPTNAQFWFDMEYMADPASPHQLVRRFRVSECAVNAGDLCRRRCLQLGRVGGDEGAFRHVGDGDAAAEGLLHDLSEGWDIGVSLLRS